ncbi:MAG: UDP-3-O-acyl-N-acetylglucosamine deacetylase [Alphaproteobacteria bacterium]|nr:UDP-3-O-acyl-N-acetylglucosamine deacetylase [Alphaproteobacteria bacterium]
MSDIASLAERVGGCRQQTLKNVIDCTGIGLHTGLEVKMTLRPAAPGSGIRFRRLDVADRDNLVPARYDRTVESLLCTSIANDAGVEVATVEHLMAALAGMGVDNLEVELDGPEVPIMDGSSEPFVYLIECAGVVAQEAERRRIKVLKTIEVGAAGSWCSLAPSRGFSFGFEIEFNNPAVHRSDGFFDLGDGVFKREISRARTFGFEREVTKLRQLGLVKGGSLDNAVVIGSDNKILNPGGLRYEDEFVRHKVLDSIGDLYLAGAPLLAHFQGKRSGHALNNMLLRALFADPEAWQFTTEMPEPVYAAPPPAISAIA